MPLVLGVRRLLRYARGSTVWPKHFLDAGGALTPQIPRYINFK